MKIISKVTTINDVIIEQNVSNFDERWIGRGAFNSKTRTWVMNIPKNGSNTIGRLIAPGNRPRADWQTERHYRDLGKTTDRFIVLLRNPVNRFAGSLAQHYAIRLEHGWSLSAIMESIDSLEWMSDTFDDMHIWPQFTYLHGLPWDQCEFMTLDNITELSDRLSISDQVAEWNITEKDEQKSNIKKRIQTHITTNTDVEFHLRKYYHNDVMLLEKALGMGKIPAR